MFIRLLNPAVWVSLLKPTLSHLHKTLSLWSLKIRLNGQIQTGREVRVGSVKYLTATEGLILGTGVHLILNHSDSSKNEPSIVLGKSVRIGDRSHLTVKSGQRMVVGDFTSTNANCFFSGDVEVGRYCVLSANIFISSTNHNFEKSPAMLIKDQDLLSDKKESQTKKTLIEDDCWIGWGVVIRNGITIGKGSIVGANSVVTQDVPPYSVVAGSPAKVLKKRLEYVPSREIKASNLETHPYLHSGFSLRAADLIEVDQRKLMPMEKVNRCVLAAGNFNEIKISLFSKKNVNGSLMLNGSQVGTLEVVQGWNEVSCVLKKPIVSIESALIEIQFEQDAGVFFERIIYQ